MIEETSPESCLSFHSKTRIWTWYINVVPQHGEAERGEQVYRDCSPQFETWSSTHHLNKLGKGTEPSTQSKPTMHICYYHNSAWHWSGFCVLVTSLESYLKSLHQRESGASSDVPAPTTLARTPQALRKGITKPKYRETCHLPAPLAGLFPHTCLILAKLMMRRSWIPQTGICIPGSSFY